MQWKHKHRKEPQQLSKIKKNPLPNGEFAEQSTVNTSRQHWLDSPVWIRFL